MFGLSWKNLFKRRRREERMGWKSLFAKVGQASIHNVYLSTPVSIYLTVARRQQAVYRQGLTLIESVAASESVEKDYILLSRSRHTRKPKSFSCNKLIELACNLHIEFSYRNTLKEFMQMRTLSSTVVASLACLFLASNADAVLLIEDFEAPFVDWESNWLGLNSNLENYYVSAGNPDLTNRGNNPDGLWMSDADGNLGTDPVVDIVFDPGFGSSLNSFSIDIAGWAAAQFQVYDSVGTTILDIPSIVLTQGALTDPGVYVNYSVLSNTGIGGFKLLRLSSRQIEGNTGIDNVIVNQAPEPATIALLGFGLLGLGLRRRRAH